MIEGAAMTEPDKNRMLRVFFPKADAKHKLGGPFARAVEGMGFEIKATPSNGMIFDVRDSKGEIEPFQIVYGRPADALSLMERNAIDCAVVGRDTVVERTLERGEQGLPDIIEIQADLGFGNCTAVFAVPEEKAEGITSPRDFLNLRENGQPLRIATSLTATARNCLDRYGIGRNDVEFVPLDGGVEVAVGLGVADMVCDLKQSGKSLKKAGLRDVFQASDTSTAVIVSRPDAVTLQLRKIIDRISAGCATCPATSPSP